MESRGNGALVIVGLMSCAMGCGGPIEDEPGKQVGTAKEALSEGCAMPLGVSVDGPGVIDISTSPTGLPFPNFEDIDVSTWRERPITFSVTRCPNYGLGTPATIRIYSAEGRYPRITPTNGKLVASCYSYWCTINDSATSSITRQFIATVDNGVSTVTSNTAIVTWGVWGNLLLKASPSTVALGTSVTITATEGLDVGPSPYYIKIFDTTTGSQLAACSSGKSCSAAVNFGIATTHKYAAYLTTLGATFPVRGAVRATAEQPITWAATGFQVTLDRQGSQIVATTNYDVGPTPYYIEIFVIPFGSGSASRLAACGSGTRCAVDLTYGYFIAFVSSSDAAYLPSGIQASSSLLPYAPID